jgi:hypothetical protein
MFCFVEQGLGYEFHVQSRVVRLCIRLTCGVRGWSLVIWRQRRRTVYGHIMRLFRLSTDTRQCFSSGGMKYEQLASKRKQSPHVGRVSSHYRYGVSATHASDDVNLSLYFAVLFLAFYAAVALLDMGASLAASATVNPHQFQFLSIRTKVNIPTSHKDYT